jgi:hypothetical protein
VLARKGDNEAFVRNLVVCENGRVTLYGATSFTPGILIAFVGA